MLTLAASLALSSICPAPTELQASAHMHAHSCSLSEQERTLIWNKTQFAVKKMYIALDYAEKEADKIKDINTRDLTKAAIQGAIGGLSGRSPYTVVICGCLAALSHIGGEAYDHFMNAREFIHDANYYAHEIDRLQRELWLDEIDNDSN